MIVRFPILIYRLFRRTTEEYMDDNCPSMAAAMSFYILLCLFPLALAAISVLGFVLRSEGVGERVVDTLVDAIPVTRDVMRDAIDGVVNARGGTGLAATLALAWAGMALFTAIRKGVNTAFGITMPKPYFTERLLELLMMLGAGLLLLVSMSASALLGVLRLGGLLSDWALPLQSDTAQQVASGIMGLTLTYVTFLALYRWVPYAKPRWRDIWLGALLGTLGFEGLKWGFAYYVQTYVNYSLLYGSIGAVVAFLIWAYASATALLYGAEFASVYPRILAAWRQPRTSQQPRSPASGPSRTMSLPPLGGIPTPQDPPAVADSKSSEHPHDRPV